MVPRILYLVLGVTLGGFASVVLIIAALQANAPEPHHTFPIKMVPMQTEVEA